MNQLARSLASPALVPAGRTAAGEQHESLFERFAWLYIFCREKIFRDDTDRITCSLWPGGRPAPRSLVLELGCGPGFYSRKIASRYPESSVLGIDRSARQIAYARARARHLKNCAFERGNVLKLPHPDASFDVIVASRLFTVLPSRDRAVAEMFRVLRLGGKCFIAEPRFAFSPSIPLLSMWVLARLNGYSGEYREPSRATALSLNDFRRLFETQPWSRLQLWRVGRYQYALCEKN
jgi:arsenite methyltransferase